MAYLFSFCVEDDEYEEDNVGLVRTEVTAIEAGCHGVKGHVVAGASSFEAHFGGTAQSTDVNKSSLTTS